MRRGGRTDLFLLQILVRASSSSESGWHSWFSSVSFVSKSHSPRQSERIWQNLSSVSSKRPLNNRIESLLISQIMSHFCFFARCFEEKRTFISDNTFITKEIICVYRTWSEDGEKVGFFIWLRKLQYMMTDTSCDHVQARVQALHRFYSYCLVDARTVTWPLVQINLSNR